MSWIFPALFVLLWSTGFIGAKLGLPYAEPFTFLELRFLCVLALLLPLCWLTKAPWPSRRRAMQMAVERRPHAGRLPRGCFCLAAPWDARRGVGAGHRHAAGLDGGPGRLAAPGNRQSPPVAGAWSWASAGCSWWSGTASSSSTWARSPWRFRCSPCSASRSGRSGKSATAPAWTCAPARRSSSWPPRC